MRELTFHGFLSTYVKNLSSQNTLSIQKLIPEAERNMRLAEPLFLYALYSGKVMQLLRAAKGTRFEGAYQQLAQHYSAFTMEEALRSNAAELPEEFHKVWRSYQVKRNRCRTDDETKELMRRRIQQLQAKKDLSNYRIYTDLKLNPGNFNAWMKYGTANKISLTAARSVLNYVRQYPDQ